MKQLKTYAICVNALKLLGDYWTLRILEALASQSMRYCEIQRAVDNVNPVTLTNRLQKMERAGLIYRTAEVEGKVSVSYSLAPLGTKALPVLTAIDSFSKASAKANSFL